MKNHSKSSALIREYVELVLVERGRFRRKDPLEKGLWHFVKTSAKKIFGTEPTKIAQKWLSNLDREYPGSNKALTRMGIDPEKFEKSVSGYVSRKYEDYSEEIDDPKGIEGKIKNDLQYRYRDIIYKLRRISNFDFEDEEDDEMLLAVKKPIRR